MRQAQDYGGTQDRGRRPYQEDAFHFQPLPEPDGTVDSLLMVLADGMGGHRGGAQASAAAVQAFVETYIAFPQPEADRLHRALLVANQRIARDASANPTLRGMGCTLLGLAVTPAGLYLISVGDSPAFLFRNGELQRLNADHSMAPVLQQAVAFGTLSQADVACHPSRQALRSAVTGGELSLIDLHREPFRLLPGDKVVAASDGLLTLSEERIAQVLGENAERTAEELSVLLVEAVTQANNPHQDNVTVMLASVPAMEAVPKPTNAGGFGRRLLSGRPAVAALRQLLQPRALAMLGVAFLLAAAALGGVTAWLHRSQPSADAAAPAAAVIAPGVGSTPPAVPATPAGAGAQGNADGPKAQPGQPAEAAETSRTGDLPPKARQPASSAPSQAAGTAQPSSADGKK